MLIVSRAYKILKDIEEPVGVQLVLRFCQYLRSSFPRMTSLLIRCCSTPVVDGGRWSVDIVWMCHSLLTQRNRTT